MSKLLEWSLGLWAEIQLAAPPVVQHTVMSRLHDAKEIARLLIRPYLTVYQWQGQGRGGPLMVNYAGLGYAGPLLKSLLFTEEPAEREVDRIPAWSLSKQVSSLAGDLTIIEASKHLIHKLPRQGAISLPFRLRHVVKVQGEWEDVRRSFRRTARRQDIRRIRKYGYEYEISQRQEDFEMFYHTMYVPTKTKRHGELVSLTPIGQVYPYFRHGFLLFVRRDGHVVSGGLCTIQQKKMVLLASTAAMNGDQQLIREGAVASVYYFLIRWAHEKGYQYVDFGTCWPLLEGIFQFKRKWGTTVTTRLHEHKQIWIRIQRDTPALRQYMRDNPCVIVGERGELQGLIVTDNPDDATPEARAEWQKRYATPGLSDLLVCSIADFLRESEKGRNETD